MPRNGRGGGKKRGSYDSPNKCVMLTDSRRKQYQEIKREWWGIPEVFDRQDTLEERHRIDVDCRRTDRTHPLFSHTYEDSPGDPQADRALRQFSTISPQLADIGAQSPSNEHIDRMGGILLTYNFYDKDLGESRGNYIILQSRY